MQRISLRLPKQTKEMINIAADILGMNLTDFVIVAALENAKKLAKEIKDA